MQYILNEEEYLKLTTKNREEMKKEMSEFLAKLWKARLVDTWKIGDHSYFRNGDLQKLIDDFKSRINLL